MNINDMAMVTDYPENITAAIFTHQLELAKKYHPIEERNGLLQTKDFPANMHDRMGQARFKDLCWRCTEELGEALDSLRTQDSIEHFHEELADGLHFLVEAALTAGYLPEHFEDHDLFSVEMGREVDDIAELPYYIRDFIIELAMACNCLKNKPWKVSHILTDIEAFTDRLSEALSQYVILCKCAGLTPHQLYDLYFRKNQVNQFRQRSGY